MDHHATPFAPVHPDEPRDHRPDLREFLAVPLGEVRTAHPRAVEAVLRRVLPGPGGRTVPPLPAPGFNSCI